jgi:hypothetical protein
MPPGVCKVCRKVLTGRKTLFCSRRCKNRDINARQKQYACQQRRGLERKLRLVARAGGCCGRCGYSRNVAALVFHHREPSAKKFSLDLRSLSNRGWPELIRELGACDLLCANCHAEVHNPQFNADRVHSTPDRPGNQLGRSTGENNVPKLA